MSLNNKDEQFKKIDVNQLFKYVISKWWIYLIVMIVSSILFYFYTSSNEYKVDEVTMEEYNRLQDNLMQVKSYNSDSIYMNINPYNEVVSCIQIYIMDSEYSNLIFTELKECVKNGEILQKMEKRFKYKSKISG